MRKPRAETRTTEAPSISYADAMRRLQEIVAAMEEGDVDVDELAASVKEAVALVSTCRSRLRGAQDEVEKALREMESEETTVEADGLSPAVHYRRPATAGETLDLDPFADE